jgi:hypothetical protein
MYFIMLRFHAHEHHSVTLLLVLIVCLQISCANRTQGPHETKPANENSQRLPQIEQTRREGLHLEFSADRDELGPGDCVELRLAVSNPSSGTVHFGVKWTLEQEGPLPIPPDAGPHSAFDVPPGGTITTPIRRLCHEGLVIGSYRFRVRADPALPGSPLSDWVRLEVVR